MSEALAKAKSKRPGPAIQHTPASSPVGVHDTSSAVSSQLGAFYTAGPILGLGGPVQTQVAIGQANDPFEREADAVADRVTAGTTVQPSAISALTPGALPQTLPVQRVEEKKPEQKVEEKKPVQKVEATKPEEKRPELKPVQKAEEKKPEQKVEEKRPVQKAEVKKPEEKKPEQKPIQKAEEKKPEQKVEEQKPVQKTQETKPEEKKPERKSIQRAEAKKPEKKKPEPMPLQRITEPEPVEDLEEKPVQTDASPGGTAAAPTSMAAAADQAIATKGPGSPLSPVTRGALESSLGADFSHVRVHDDSTAQEAASALNARAFTHGNDIWLGRGASQNDLHLIAHEATHVVQQSGGVQRMVQRAETTPPAVGQGPAAAAAGGGAVGNLETGVLDPAAKTLTFKQIEIPAFKKDARRGALYDAQKPLTRKRGFKRGNPNQREKWKEQIKKDTIKAKLEEKVKAAKGAEAGVSKTQVFTVPTRGGGTPFFVGTLDDVAKELTTPYWGGQSKKPPTKLFDVDHIVELQLANWEGSGSANELGNMELLERSANRSSGSTIATNINNKVKDFLKTQGTATGGKDGGDAAKETPGKGKKGGTDKKATSGVDKVKADYDLVFQEAVGKGGEKVGLTDFWEQKDIEEGKHLEPLEATNLDQIGGRGKVMLFPRASGGLAKRFDWRDSDKGTKAADSDEKYWLKPFTIENKSFITTGDDVENSATFGTLTISIPANDPQWQPYGPESITVNRIPGAKYAGYLNINEVKSRAQKIEKKGASPVRVDQFDILPEEGLYVTGQVLPDIPLIKDVGLDFEVRGGDLTLSKTFKTGDFTVPKPLTVTDSSLTIAASTRIGLGVEGQVSFAIDKVGEGYLAGGGSTAGGFHLKGGFSFDTRLFDPAEINMEYKDNVFSIDGHIGIKEGKVRGVKSADFTVAYKAGRFDASGTAELSFPGVKKGSMSLSYSESEGFAIGGSFELADNIPGIKGGSGQAQIKKRPDVEGYDVTASGKAEPKIPGVNAAIAVAYENGAITIEGSAAYEKGMLKGSILVGVTNRPVDEAGRPGGEPTADLRAYGGGTVTIRIAPWLQGTIGVKLLPNGEIEVSGSVGLPSSLDIFPEKKLDKNIFTIGIDIPIVGVAVAGQRIGIFADISGGLDLSAGIGPGQLQELGLTVTYNPAHEEQTHVTGGAKLHIPAHAGLRLFVRGGLGVGIPIVSAQAGLEIGGQLGLEGAVDAGVQVDWTPTQGLKLDALGEIYVEPKLKFDITGFVLVEADLWITTIELYSKRWQLAGFEYGSGLRFGVKFPIHYEEGKPFDISLSDVQFQVPDIKPKELLSDLIKRIA
jgi:hypothetical protein